jgi:hypothetical protein
MLHYLVYLVNSWLSSIQASGILTQLPKFLQKCTIFIKLLQKQSCNVHMFTLRNASASAF